MNFTKRLTAAVALFLILIVIPFTLKTVSLLDNYHQIPILICMGLWTWAFNMHVLNNVGINVGLLLEDKKIINERLAPISHDYNEFYHVATLYSAVVLAFLMLREVFGQLMSFLMWVVLVGMTLAPTKMLLPAAQREWFLE